MLLVMIEQLDHGYEHLIIGAAEDELDQEAKARFYRVGCFK